MNYGYTNIVEYGYIDKEESSEPAPNISWVEFSGEKDYTVENSIEYTTRDMVLEGETIQNLCTKLNGPYNVSDFTNGQNNQVPLVFNLQKGKTYSIKLNVSNYNNPVNTEGIAISFSNGGNSYKFVPNSDFMSFVATDRDITLGYLIMYFTDGQQPASATVESIMILEGDWTNKEISEYFEGIKSVGEDDNKISILSRGKNLCPVNTHIADVKEVNDLYNKLDTAIVQNIKVDKNRRYKITFKSSNSNWSNMKLFGHDIMIDSCNTHQDMYDKIVTKNIGIERPWTLGMEGYNYISISTGGAFSNTVANIGEVITLEEIQLLESDADIKYEPYKENKKDILLPFEGGLKSVGSTKDVINSTTRKFVQNIGERAYQEGDELLENAITDKITTYYILDNPIEYDLAESINLNTYNKVTHITTEATSSFEIPLEIDGVLSNLISENQSLKVRTTSLEEENQALQEDVTKAQEDAGSALMGIAELYETTM